MDFILDKNLYGYKGDKAGYNYETNLKFISNDSKVSACKLTVAPKLYLETFMKTPDK